MNRNERGENVVEGQERTICLLNDSFPPIIDGVANTVLNYAENIEAHYGHAVVVTPAVPGAEDGAYPFPVVRYPSIDTRKLVGYVAGNPFSPQTIHRIKTEKPQLLHTHCPVTSTLLARQLRQTMDLPLIMTYHTKFDIEVEKAIHGKMLQKGAIATLIQNVSACDEVWIVSRGAGENLRSMGYEGEYVLMENGVDLPKETVPEEEAAVLTAGFDLPVRVPVFLFVGRMRWYKGQRIILDALAALKQKDIPFRMVFIGSGGDEAEIKTYARQLGLEKQCHFPGAIHDRRTLRAWYSRADLFLFPSTFDTNGLVVREAAACDLPSVLVAGSCAAEGVTDGHNGFLIEENAASLAAKLEALCAAPEVLPRVGKTAGEELYLSWQDAVARAAERYEIVLDDYRSGRIAQRRLRSDRIFKMSGELMGFMGQIRAVLDKRVF